MKRELHDHKVAGGTANDELAITVLDEPGPGGACHEYSVSDSDGTLFRVAFQKGPILEEGINGVTHEALLAILIDRLRGFQSGQYSCKENAVALTHLETALLWLQKRTMDRLRRGVEGTSAK